jgi:hypothetical protein
MRQHGSSGRSNAAAGHGTAAGEAGGSWGDGSDDGEGSWAGNGYGDDGEYADGGADGYNAGGWQVSQQTLWARNNSRFGGREFVAGLGCLAESHRTQHGMHSTDVGQQQCVQLQQLAHSRQQVRQVAAGATAPAAVMARVAGPAMGTATMESMQTEARTATMQVGGKNNTANWAGTL